MSPVKKPKERNADKDFDRPDEQHGGRDADQEQNRRDVGKSLCQIGILQSSLANLSGSSKFGGGAGNEDSSRFHQSSPGCASA